VTLPDLVRLAALRACTSRELDVLALRAAGHSLSRTAEILGISRATVTTTQARAYRKIRAELARAAKEPTDA
jgi:DNA-binding CsgD family transcriptional regulator